MAHRSTLLKVILLGDSGYVVNVESAFVDSVGTGKALREAKRGDAVEDHELKFFVLVVWAKHLLWIDILIRSGRRSIVPRSAQTF